MKDCVHEMGICYLWILSIVINKKFGISLPTRLRIIIDFFPPMYTCLNLCYHTMIVVTPQKLSLKNMYQYIVGSIF